MRLEMPRAQYRSYSSCSNRSSRSTPSFVLPRVRGGGRRLARSDGLNGLNGLNRLNSGASPTSGRNPRAWLFQVIIATLVVFSVGCDPGVNLGGTFFPGWMAAFLIGSALTVAIRYLFVFTGLEPHVGRLALIYMSLGVLLSLVSWLILYRS